MDLIDLLRIGLRRWYVAVPAVLLVLAGSLLARSSVELTYKSTGSLLLFAPREPDASKNRILAFNSLEVPASVAAQVVGDAVTRERVEARGGSKSYELGLDPANPAPLVLVVATGTLDQAQPTVQLVLDEVSADLERRQTALGAPPETWITTEVVTPPTEPEPQNGSRTRAFIAVFLVGLALAAGLTIAVDLLLDRRRRRTGSAADRDGLREYEVALPRSLLPAPRDDAVHRRPPRIFDSVDEGVPPHRIESDEFEERVPPRLVEAVEPERGRPVSPAPSAPRRSEEEAPTRPAGEERPAGGAGAHPIRRPHPYLVANENRQPAPDDAMPPSRKSGTD